MRLLLSGFVALLGCSGEYAVRIQASDALLEGAANAEVAVVANCRSQASTGRVSGDPHLFYSVGESAPSLGSVPPGNHGLFARFLDAECNVVAVGCEEIDVEEGGSATLSVAMSAAAGFACEAGEVCRAGECVVSSFDGGPDGAPGDAGADSGSDAGSDAGPDAGSDAGPDAGPDAGADAGTATCASANLCDDFEGVGFDYEIDIAEGSSVGLTRDRAHSGEQSVLVRAAGSTISTKFIVTPFDDTQTGERWVRAWYFLPADFTGLTPISVESDTSAVTVFTTGPEYALLNTYRFPEQAEDVSVVPLPGARWTCVEVHLDYDPESSDSNTVELFIDGVAAAALVAELPTALPSVALGAPFREEGDTRDYEIYIDDIAMSVERIGCF